eukprot:gene6018-biopygen5368
MTGALWGDHDTIDVLVEFDQAKVHGETVREDDGLALGEIREDVALVNRSLLHVGQADHDDVRETNRLGRIHNLEAVLFRDVPHDSDLAQREIFGPVLVVMPFADEAEAVRLANGTDFGLVAGVWTRDGARAFRIGRGIQAGRVWTNCYHLYPAHAAFGGYKQSGIGRENHKMMLDHYQQTKNLLV